MTDGDDYTAAWNDAESTSAREYKDAPEWLIIEQLGRIPTKAPAYELDKARYTYGGVPEQRPAPRIGDRMHATTQSRKRLRFSPALAFALGMLVGALLVVIVLLVIGG